MKKATNPRVVAGYVAFLVFASILELSFAHRGYSSWGYGSCGHSYHRRYPRWYDSHWGSCGGYRSCGSRRRYYGNPIGILGDIIYAGMNSLDRQQHRNVAVDDHQEARYSIEDYGRKGLELTVEIPDLTAREIDLEIIRENGVNTLAIRSKPGFRRRGYGNIPKFSQSFVINDSTIDVDGVAARVRSEILTISLPRKKKKAIPIKKNRSIDRDQKSGDGILVYNSKSEPIDGAKERLTRQSVLVKETPRKTSDEQSQIQDDDLFISEAEDIW